MPHTQSPHRNSSKFSSQIIATSALMLVIVFASQNHAEAQNTAYPLPTFGAPVSYPIGVSSVGWNHIKTGDFNNDGKVDVVVYISTEGPSLFCILLNNGFGTFGAPITIQDYPQYPGPLEVADFDNDGNSDIVIGIDSGAFTIFHGDGTGHFSRISGGGNNGGSDVLALAVGDLNHDNIPDVFAGNFYRNQVWLGDHDTPGNFSLSFEENNDPWFPLPGSRVLSLGDFHGDGNFDVFLTLDLLTAE